MLITILTILLIASAIAFALSLIFKWKCMDWLFLVVVYLTIGLAVTAVVMNVIGG